MPKPSFWKTAGSNCVGFGVGVMKAETVPRNGTELTHLALHAQRSALLAPICTGHIQAYIPSLAHHSWHTWPYSLGPVCPMLYTPAVSSPIREHSTVIFSRMAVITCKKPSRPGLPTTDIPLIGRVRRVTGDSPESLATPSRASQPCYSDLMPQALEHADWRAN